MNRSGARAVIGLVIGAAGVVAASGCSSQHDEKQTITVLAAASLTEPLTTLAHQYEQEHPGTHVVVSFAASSTIVTQLSHGAPADVVALADTETSKKLPADVTKGRRWTPFATNELQIVTPKTNPARVAQLADLEKADTVLCAAQVPCGRAANKALARAQVRPHVVSYEKDVKATLAKVVSGDAQAAIVYRTDVRAAGAKVTGVNITAASNVTTTLPIAVWSDKDAAKGFAGLVTGEAGRRVLTGDGFGLPE